MPRIGVIELLIIGLCGFIVVLAMGILIVVLVVSSQRKRTRSTSAPDRVPGSTSIMPPEATSMDSGSQKAESAAWSDPSSRNPDART